MPDPFNASRRQSEPTQVQDDVARKQRQRARDSFEASKRNAERERQRAKRAEQDRGMDEMRSLLDKLREENNSSPKT